MKQKWSCLALYAFAVLAIDLVRAAPAKAQTPAEAKAVAILRDVEAASKKHRTLTADFEVRELGNLKYKGRFRVMKPNYFFASYQDILLPKISKKSVVSDGEYRWEYPLLPEENEYSQFKLKRGDVFVGLSSADTIIEMFFDLQRALDGNSLQQPFRFIGTQKWRGKTFHVLEHIEFQTPWKGRTYLVSTKLYVGNNNIIQREIHHIHTLVPKQDPKMGSLDEFSMFNIKLDVPMTPAEFKWKAPVGAVVAK